MRSRLPQPPSDVWFLAETTRTNEDGTHTYGRLYTSTDELTNHMRFYEDSRRITVTARRLWRMVDGQWVEHDVLVADTHEPQWVGGPK